MDQEKTIGQKAIKIPKEPAGEIREEDLEAISGGRCRMVAAPDRSIQSDVKITLSD